MKAGNQVPAISKVSLHPEHIPLAIPRHAAAFDIADSSHIIKPILLCATCTKHLHGILHDQQQLCTWQGDMNTSCWQWHYRPLSTSTTTWSCRDAAKKALLAYNGYMQLGGGVNPENAAEWLDAGASHVIVTSYIFQGGELDEDRLKALVSQKSSLWSHALQATTRDPVIHALVLPVAWGSVMCYLHRMLMTMSAQSCSSCNFCRIACQSSSCCVSGLV